MVIRKKSLYKVIELFSMFLVMSFPGFIKYILFTAWIAFYVLKKEIRYEDISFKIMLPAVTCTIIGILMTMRGAFNIETIKEILFVMLPPFGAIVICENISKKERIEFINKIFGVISILFFLFNIRTFSIENLMESQYAFIFGVFVIYYFYRKEKYYFLVSLVLLILANKRIAIGGVVVSIIALTLFGKKKKDCSENKKRRFVYFIAVITIAGLLGYVYLCRSNGIAAIMRSHNMNSNGRIEMWMRFYPYFQFSVCELGRGLGYISTVLKQWNVQSFARLHNDIMVLYIELGHIGFIVNIMSYFLIVVAYIKRINISYKLVIFCCSLIIYNFICFCTDNISIYINYLFPFYIIWLDCMYEEKVFNSKRNCVIRKEIQLIKKN